MKNIGQNPKVAYIQIKLTLARETLFGWKNFPEWGDVLLEILGNIISEWKGKVRWGKSSIKCLHNSNN